MYAMQIILELDALEDVDALPMGPEDLSPAGVETVVLAKPVPSRGQRVGGDDAEIKVEEDEEDEEEGAEEADNNQDIPPLEQVEDR